MIFLPADNVESKCAILIIAMISFKISRARDFETKLGDQTIMHRIAREENQPAGRRPAFSTAEAIAMSATISRRGVDEPPPFQQSRHYTNQL
jgi:CRP-like cAMP-binding protein